MTRKEEIETAWLARYFQSNHRYDEKTFREAVEWADKTMIEKAYKWIKENFENYVGVDVSEYYIYDDAFADDFLKAMEE